jgi:hypothetical protein
MSRYRPYALSKNEVWATLNPNASDNTAAINSNIIQAAAAGKELVVPPGVYKIVGTINVGTSTNPLTITIRFMPGAIFEHYPINDTTDMLAIFGLDSGKTILIGGVFKGLQNGHGFGRDGIRVGKGDYPVLRNTYIVTPKRDGVQVRPTVTSHWVENLDWDNVKIQFPQGVSSTLPSTINSSVTSFTVNSFSSTASTPYWPDAPFKVQCESEIMLVGAYDRVNAPNTFSSVTRGVDSTTAASHTSGKTVVRISPKLTAGISSSDTTIVTEWSSLYPEAPFNIKIEDEIITVGAINKSTHTLSSLTRGAEGTTAAAHSSAIAVPPWLGRDGFHFEIAGAATGTFINQGTLKNCESRTTPRHALMIQNDSVNASSAQKISAFEFINCEFAAADGPHDIVRFQGSPGDGTSVNTPLIENMVFRGCTIECTSQPSPKRLAAGIFATGRMAGLLKLENTIIYGTTSFVVGVDLFDKFDVANLNTSAPVPHYESHQGLYWKYRSATTLAQNAHVDVISLQDGEVLSVDVLERYNNNPAHNLGHYAYGRTAGWGAYQLVEQGVDMTTADGFGVFIKAKCGQGSGVDGNIVVTLDGTPFNVPVTTADQYTPDRVAKALGEFTYTGYRALWNGKQSVLFTRASSTALATFSINYGTTGVDGTDAAAKALRITNLSATSAVLETMIQRVVKEAGS